MGSIDMQSLACEAPKVGQHIYLGEKAPWVVLPDDGAERWSTQEMAHLITFDSTAQGQGLEDLKIA